jgi:hypothetical protein
VGEGQGRGFCPLALRRERPKRHCCVKFTVTDELALTFTRRVRVTSRPMLPPVSLTMAAHEPSLIRAGRAKPGGAGAMFRRGLRGTADREPGKYAPAGVGSPRAPGITGWDPRGTSPAV